MQALPQNGDSAFHLLPCAILNQGRAPARESLSFPRASMAAPLAHFFAAALFLFFAPAAAATVRWPHRARAGGSAALCRRTDFPAICFAASKLAHAGGAAALAQASILVAMEKAREGRAMAARLSHSRAARGSVETCRQTYASALADLQSSLQALRRNSVADLQINLSAVISDVGTCDDGYAERGPRARGSPFFAVGRQIHAHASNGLALCQLIKSRA
ncbi:uncharacterized protein LOC144700439 [Wolffia australiana]